MIGASAGLLVLIALGAASPSADTAPAGARPGRTLFERAQANFNRGHFDEARADYQAAYAVEPLPELLFDIGQCYRNLGDYAQAEAYFHRYAVLEPRSPNRAATERLATEMNRLAIEQRGREVPPRLTASFATAPAPAGAEPRPSDPAAAAAFAPSVHQTDTRGARPVYRRPWFWAGVGGAVLLGTAAVFAISRDGRSGTLSPIDTR